MARRPVPLPIRKQELGVPLAPAWRTGVPAQARLGQARHPPHAYNHPFNAGRLPTCSCCAMALACTVFGSIP